MRNTCHVPVLGFAAWSGAGKTTLLTALLPLLNEAGVRVGVIKHAHHAFEIDHEGKDSYKLRKAGARQMLIGSSQRWALMVELEQQREPRLNDLISKLDTNNLDLILVEGFKPEHVDKIEIVRPSLNKQPFYPDDPDIIAVATDGELPVATSLPVLDLNNGLDVATFIIDNVINRDNRRINNTLN